MRLYEPTQEPHFDMFRDFMEEPPGMSYHDYDALHYFNTDRSIAYRQLVKARRYLQEARLLGYDHNTMVYALRNNWSGRLHYDNKENPTMLQYDAGQYYPTEFRGAIACVLDVYVHLMRLKGE